MFSKTALAITINRKRASLISNRPAIAFNQFPISFWIPLRGCAGGWVAVGAKERPSGEPQHGSGGAPTHRLCARPNGRAQKVSDRRKRGGGDSLLIAERVNYLKNNGVFCFKVMVENQKRGQGGAPLIPSAWFIFSRQKVPRRLSPMTNGDAGLVSESAPNSVVKDTFI